MVEINNMGLFVVILLIVNASAQLLVTVPNGQIRGHELKSFTNKSYHAFEGVPFAKPPLGKLRFQAPEAADNWNGVLETTELKYCCYSVTQDFDRENEDCLYLNVFTPILDRENNSTKLPVMFWFYGGGFINGCANWWPQYWMDEDIVVVIPNYRVGPFGFLATGDLAAPGNAGLKDQNLALQWAYENVHLFGGDNQRITIAGQSAGGSSVGWQLLNPTTEGMFRAAIIESGSPMNTWAFRDNAYEYALNLAKTVNDSLSDLSTRAIVEFLQGLDSKTIDVASTTTPVKEPLPVIEPLHPGAFITEAMYELFDSGNYTQVPMIVGVNSEEKITLASDAQKLRKYAISADENLDTLVPGNFNYKPNVTSLRVGREIRNVYAGNDTFENQLGRYIRLSSDNQYTRSVIKQGKLMSKYNDVYFYIFSYDGEAGGVNETFPVIHPEIVKKRCFTCLSLRAATVTTIKHLYTCAECGNEWANEPIDADSVAHAEELKYNWSTKPLDELNEADRLVHYRMMRLWTNFVKYLNPTPSEDDLLQNLTWQQVTQEAFNFLNINASLSLETNPKGDYFIGWERIFDDYAQRPYKTY